MSAFKELQVPNIGEVREKCPKDIIGPGQIAAWCRGFREFYQGLTENPYADTSSTRSFRRNWERGRAEAIEATRAVGRSATAPQSE